MTTPTTLEMTGGEALARMLAALAPDTPVFGMGGFQLLPFYDAGRRLGLTHHLVNDERAGVFMADAWARSTGRVGVVDATLGPGATNLVTGLVEALNAGIPLVAIVGDAHRDHKWKNMTQECRQVDILRPCVKEVLEATSTERLPELLRRAFAVAVSGRPGPVVVDVAEDIAHAVAVFDADVFTATPPSGLAARTRPGRADVARAAELIRSSVRPLVLAGGGIHLSGANESLLRLAEAASLPVAHTMSGKGSIPCTHALSAGVFGRYDRIANELVAEADVLVVIGCKLGEVATKRYSLGIGGPTTIHLDVLPEELGRTTDVGLALVGDARETIEALLEELGDDTGAATRKAHADDVATRMATWWTEYEPRMLTDERPISMLRLLREINHSLPADGVLIADGGFAAHWAALLFDTKIASRGFLADRGFASIGYGLPAAIGASLADPDRPVVALTGDGGFNMMLGELETARRTGANATIVIVNNAASGYIKALQHLMYGAGSYAASDLAETNYADVVTAMGCEGIRVEDPADLPAALAAGMASPRLTVLDVVVTRDPERMLPGVDSRIPTVTAGDRIA